MTYYLVDTRKGYLRIESDDLAFIRAEAKQRWINLDRCDCVETDTAKVWTIAK